MKRISEVIDNAVFRLVSLIEDGHWHDMASETRQITVEPIEFYMTGLAVAAAHHRALIEMEDTWVRLTDAGKAYAAAMRQAA